MIALKKEQQPNKCVDYRTMSLIAHESKIVARIQNRSLGQKMEDVLGEDLFAFKKGKGSRFRRKGYMPFDSCETYQEEYWMVYKEDLVSIKG